MLSMSSCEMANQGGKLPAEASRKGEDASTLARRVGGGRPRGAGGAVRADPRRRGAVAVSDDPVGSGRVDGAADRAGGPPQRGDGGARAGALRAGGGRRRAGPASARAPA